MGRLTEVNFPIGKTSYEYYDSSNQVKTKRQLTTATDIETTLTYDGLGREKTGCQKDGSDSICTESAYDGAGRVRQVSNPYRGADTKQWTTTAYDAAGRVVSVTRPDGSAASTSFSGNATTATDEAGKKRKSYIDGLGRLASVVEDPTGTPLTTTYSYDALDDLTGVNQSGRTRQFTYDSLKRLLTAANPESGTTTYAYDLNGNLVKKTDARSTATCYGVWSGTQCDGSGYDALNRPTRKSYSDVTPAVTYTWDTLKHGRLSSVSSSVSTTNYTAYDNMGRVTASSQVTDGTTYPFSYEYNDAGGLTKLTYPSGRVVSYTYADTGWLSAVRKGADGSGGNYAGSIAYAAHGGIRSLALGNGVTETTGYNNRLQPVSMQAGSLLTLGYAYCTNGGASCSTNNGNLLRQTVGFGSWNRTVDYTYGDAMNRLTAAVETGGNSEWSRTYGYDAYGNRWVSTWSAALPPASGTPTTSGWFDSNNRLTGVNFDTAGNQTSLLGYGFTYDAESRQKTATVNTATTQYSYDGDGRRVKTVSGGVATIYVYDAQGLLAAEYGGTGSPTGGTQYLSADHLGSTRLVTDSSAGVVKRYDYLPFGEEIPVGIGDRTTGQGYGADAFRIKFTGKERDAETGLDYFGARYFSGAQGRFTSADEPFADQNPADPQSWNLYGYGRNNPLLYTDPTGAYVCGSNMSDGDCRKFEEARGRAIDAAEYLKALHGEKAKQYTDARRAIDAYGEPGIDNGVTVDIGSTANYDATTAAYSSVSKTAENPNGQDIQVNFKSAGALSVGLIAHEGSHVADGSAWTQSGFSAAKKPMAYGSEVRAYQVQASIYEGLGYRFQFVGSRPPGYLLYVQNWAQMNTNNVINAILRDLYGLKPTSARPAFRRLLRGAR